MFSAISVLFLVSSAVFAFNPVHDFNVSKIYGTWNLSSYYDFSGNNNATLCLQFKFNPVDETTLALNSYIYDISDDGNWINGTTKLKYTTDPAEYEYAGIKYAVLNYTEENGYEKLVLGANWTKDYYVSQYFVYGLVKGPAPAVQMSDVLVSYNLIPIVNYNYFYINQGCYSGGILPIPHFDATNLINTWNLVGVYDTVGYFVWPNVRNCIVKIEKVYMGYVAAFQGSYYFGSFFQYNTSFYPERGNEGNLFGWQLNSGTSMVVNYAFDENNYVLIAGDQSIALLLSSNMLSANATMISTFESKLAGLAGYSSKYVYSINNMPFEDSEL